SKLRTYVHHPHTPGNRRNAPSPPHRRRLQRPSPDAAFPLVSLEELARESSPGNQQRGRRPPRKNGTELNWTVGPLLPARAQRRFDPGPLPRIVRSTKPGAIAVGASPAT